MRDVIISLKRMTQHMPRERKTLARTSHPSLVPSLFPQTEGHEDDQDDDEEGGKAPEDEERFPVGLGLPAGVDLVRG